MAALGLLLATLTAAHAGRLMGPEIDDVLTDRVMYPPGQAAAVTVVLRTPFAGRVDLVMWNGRGQVIDRQSQDLAPGAHTDLHFVLHPPAMDGRGYLLGITASDAHGIVDTASGAIDVGTDWRRFPRYGWVSRFEPGTDAAGLVGLLAAYRLNALQFYDVAWQAELPAPPAGASTWHNLANRTIDRGVVNALLTESHKRGMIGLLFTDWAAAYHDYASDGSGAQLSWGLFDRACDSARPCTLADQYQFGGGPGVWRGYGWATDNLAIFDPSNHDWQQYLFRNIVAAYRQFAFDGWQIDTLGAPDGPRWAYDGSSRDMGVSLVRFTNAAGTATGRRTVLNDVSRWQQDAVDDGTTTDVLYTEIHPAFGDTAFYPALNGMTDQARQHTSRAQVIAAYMDQQKAASAACRSATTCRFGDPGIRTVDSMMLAAGADHFELGDSNLDCPLPQAKMASNIFLPGPMLCMDQPLARWMVDAMNFAVGYENLLRDGVSDAVEAASISGDIKGSTTGAAGAIYLLPKTKAGMQILHLLNFSHLPTNRLDDPMGDQPAPPVVHDLAVTMHYAGDPVRADRNRLMWASSDLAHGAPQRIAHYTTGQDAAGHTVTFTLPSLRYWDMVWLETGALAGRGFTVSATAPLRGSWYQDSSLGAGSFSTILHLCCGQTVHFADLQFGRGVGHVTVRVGNQAPASLRFALDSSAGPTIATVTLPPGTGFGEFRDMTSPAIASGEHDLYLTAPDQPVTVESMVFR